MAQGETPITIVGNLVADPELRYTPSGTAVANFRVASTPRRYDSQSNQWVDGDALFLACNIWRQAAENVANSLNKGDRVIVTGRLRQRSYDTRDGEKRTVFEVEVDEVGPSLKYQITVSERNHRDTGGRGPGPGPGNQGNQGSWGGSGQTHQPNTGHAPGNPPNTGYGSFPAGDDDPWSSAPPQGSSGDTFDDSENPPF